MDNETRISTFKPALVLFVLSPVIAELLFGSTPASRSPQLIIEAFFYGSGALLVREFARRYHLGWLSVIILGIAFGIIEECLTLQSAFNPKFLGNNLTFGRFWGVNWVWAEFIIGYHAIWSITIPILFAELLSHDKSHLPWLSKAGIWITGGIYLLSCAGFFFIFYQMSGFTTSWIHYSTAGLFALVLITLSLYVPAKPLFQYKLEQPSYFITGLAAFLTSSLWLGLLAVVFIKDSGIPAWVTQLAGVCLIAFSFFVFAGWSKQNWNDQHRFSLACGGLLASMLFGLIVLIESNNILDIICQILLIITTSGMLILFHQKILINRTQTAITD